MQSLPASFFERYTVIEKIGEGGQSVVYLTRDSINQNALKAVKKLKADYFAKNQGRDLIREYQILESLDHDNLVRVFECRIDPEDKSPVLITEYVEGTADLDGYISGGIELTPNEKLQIAYQTLLAIRYLHRKKIAHGDLKPSNILIQRDPHHKKPPLVKLIDFGVAQDLTDAKARERVGTAYYIAPEAVTDGVIPASDLYSYGVILYKLFISPVLPYKGQTKDQIFAAHFGGQWLFKEEDFQRDDVPAPILELMRSCLDQDPLSRPRKLPNVLRQLRFDFPDSLISCQPPSADCRARQYIGMKSNLYVAQKLLNEHFSETVNPHSRHLLCVSAPSGGGKSRYLGQVGRLCQKSSLHHVTIAYRPVAFWDFAMHSLMREFSASRATKRQALQLQQAMQSDELNLRLMVFSRYLNALANELGGLVLLIDGLGEHLPTDFIKILKSVLNPNHKGRLLSQKQASKLVVITSVNSKAIDTTAENESTISNLLSDLHQNFTDQTPNGDSEYAQAQWRQIPSQIRSLGMDGTAHLLALPPWSMSDVKVYLKEVFSEQTFSDEFIAKLSNLSQGNPGILQAICNEAIVALEQTENVSEALIQELLLELLRNAYVADLLVYKLKYYDDQAKTLLALVASMQECPRKLIGVVWQAFYGAEGVMQARQILIRGFDDGLLHINDTGKPNYFLANQNLSKTLQAIARNPTTPAGFVLRKLLQHSTHLLNDRQRIELAQFMGLRGPWTQAISDYFNTSRRARDRIAIADSVEKLRKELGIYMDFAEVDWDKRLSLDYVAFEIKILMKDLQAARDLGEHILDTIRDRNDAFANALRAKTQLSLGVVLRLTVDRDESIDLLQDAIDSELLNDSDHYYAMGNMALCQMFEEAAMGPVEEETMSYIQVARSELRVLDPVRFAILTGSLGGFYLDHKHYQKALPYFEGAARLFASLEEPTRQVPMQLYAGRCHYSLGNYEEALGIFERTLTLSERLGLDGESVKLLIFIIRTRYFMGDFRKFAPACLQLTALCERLNDLKPLASIIEPAAHAYLEDGKVGKALDLVHAHLLRLKNNPDDPRAQLDLCICELLLSRIHQTMGRWQDAAQHNRLAHERIVSISKDNLLSKDAEQVHLLYEVEMLCHDNGPAKALDLLERYFKDKVFTEFNLKDAYFIAFHYAVQAEDEKRVVHYLPQCMHHAALISTQQRLAFLVDLGRHYLDMNDLPKARATLRDGARLLNNVTNHLTRAYLYDQQARLAGREGKRDAALQRWNTADQEFQLHLKTWGLDDKERFKETSSEFQEHRVIFMAVQAGQT